MILRSDDTIRITTDFMVALNEAENRKDLKAREEAARKERRAVQTGWWENWFAMVDAVNAGKAEGT
jgi:hypothetical protein